MKPRVSSSLAIARVPLIRRLPAARFLLAAAFALALSSHPVSADDDKAANASITATRLPLNTDDPMQKQVDRLLYRGGLELRSSNVYFGGLSGLDIVESGKKLIAISDNGRWISMDLLYDEQGALKGAENGVVKPVKPADGFTRRGRWNDAEELAPDGNGGYFVAFERQHRIWHYRTPPADPFESVPVPIKAPDDIAQQPSNGGIEAMARLCDRRLLAISEKGEAADGQAKAWVFDGKQWKALSYALTGSFRPTGAAVLPDCNLVVLERSFTLSQGVRSRVTLVQAKTIRPGAILRGEELAQLVPPVTVDNMEGIAARRGDSGETLLYLVSDNNFNPLQRTILMMFELLPPAEKAK